MVVSSGIQLPYFTTNSASIEPTHTKNTRTFKLNNSNKSEVKNFLAESESGSSSASDESALPDLVYDDNDINSYKYKEKSFLISVIVSYVSKTLADLFSISLENSTCRCGCVDYSTLRLFITEIVRRSQTSLHGFKMSTIYLLRFHQVLQYMSEHYVVPDSLCLKIIALCSFMLTSTNISNQPVDFNHWQLISGLSEARLKSEFRQFIGLLTENYDDHKSLVVTTNEFHDLNLKLKEAICACVQVI
ncbi:Hypothetical protein PP7435_CHR1-1093 [Komagataella phaffii CBS 7435]|uniref:Cyclin N-terminal domain-containing protein n=2 Tax=Komagataella phaffii TaxID=460519 RepID=C4QY25_KOMPG|nr:Hypothetical protein PAS_chr1-4_0307 [Komagataella phaffii GS115]AOA61531.1 GQ67_01865T0 [Komagataella phaffii]CAH2446968.1 Hypothetical protein BQ9382_C1-5745 [Komagataella phaffii CBS 7435]AOA65436.1 GQ68_01880T0 [Komagataella phaffii GS115]CAY68148.1 Hypothetical protein PAS_chr1-4_0307 [Komagataella phaffii GS115]CCA37223.1 Hypothetical protein PP7435_CHR1-1093 [Komagataella phaffii CBS 7435]